MGIYPDHNFQPLPDGNILETVTEPGLSRARILTPSEWKEERDDCFCCSCIEYEGGGTGIDPYCRNHGFAGRRPCETHGMAGQADYESEVMPESVQKARERNGN